MFKMLLSCLLLSSTLSLAAEPEWKHITLKGDRGIEVDLAFQVTPINRGKLAPELWVNVTSPTLNSDSIVDAQLWIADVDNKKFREYRKLELLFNKRKNHFTWFAKNVVFFSEGTTGGDVSPRYAISIVQKESGTRETSLVDVTEVDLKNAR